MEQNSKFVLDSGMFIAYFQDENDEFSQILDEFIFSEDSTKLVYSNQLNLTEILYILCRNIGLKKARNLIAEMKSLISIIKIENIYDFAGEIKCQFPIALSNCFSIATGLMKNAPIMFLEESELTTSLQERLKDDFKANLKVISL